MSEWDDQLAAHPSIENLRQARESLQAAKTPEDLNVLEASARAQKVLDVALSVIESSDPELVSAGMLDRLLPVSAPILGQAQAFNSSPDIDQARALNAYLDPLLDVLGSWPAAAQPSADVLREAAANYRRSVGQLIRGLEAEVLAVSESIQSARAEIESLAGLRGQDAEAAQSRLQDLEQTIEQQKARLDAAVAGFQSQFSEAEAARRAASDAAVSEFRSAVATVASDAAAEANKAIEDMRASAAAILKELEAAKAKAETLLDAVGAAALGGGYRKYARTEAIAAWAWVALAVLFLALVAGLGVWYVQSIGGREFSLQDFWLRLVIVVPLVAIAGLAISQSGKHRANERKAKKDELELAALGPYIALLPPEKQAEVRERMVEQFFGRPDEGLAPGESIGAGQLWGALEKVISALLPGRR